MLCKYTALFGIYHSAKIVIMSAKLTQTEETNTEKCVHLLNLTKSSFSMITLEMWKQKCEMKLAIFFLQIVDRINFKKSAMLWFTTFFNVLDHMQKFYAFRKHFFAF